MKKAQGLTLNTMAVAVIVLVVIVVTIGIFTGVVGDIVPFFEGRTECQAQASKVTPYCSASEECSEDGGVAVFGLGCNDIDADKPYCCIKN